ncbi:hypothetical protein [Flavobacterium filum]|uniref:hypothetical protein n=1 Tax=Flavobacterium TaxID=237 RepID=UPI00040CFFDC|nr:hypothetical protein [Flavobacterium filum]
MKNEELNKIIEQLESGASKEKATFGIYYLEGEDEMHIKANKDGFELFACEMLKASRDSEDVIENSEKKYIDFGYKEKWIEGELIAYIKPVSESRNEIKEEKPYRETFKDLAFKYGCLTIIGMIILSIIIGICTIVNWFL